MTHLCGHKHELAEMLAQQAEGGVIVEIGVNKGNGLLALARGSSRGRQLPVYGLDPYLSFRDAFGTEYGPADYEICQELLHLSPLQDYIQLQRQDALDVARVWARPVALLWIDLGVAGELPESLLRAWLRHLAPRGVAVLTGLEHARLQPETVASIFLERGELERILPEQTMAVVLQRPQPTRAAFYLVSGEQFVREANRSARSVHQQLGIETYLFLEGKTEEKLDQIDHVLSLPGQRGPFWYLDSTRYFNQAVQQLAHVQQLMYLDSDTWICQPCLEMFDLLDHFDLCLGHEPQRDAIPSAWGTPAAFSALGLGVNLFNNTPDVRALLHAWLELYEQDWRLYGNNDQAALRDELFLAGQAVPWYVLPPEYCLRFDFGAWVVGRVRILHGRVGGDSAKELEPVAREINSDTRMRIWCHGLLPRGVIAP